MTLKLSAFCVTTMIFTASLGCRAADDTTKNFSTQEEVASANSLQTFNHRIFIKTNSIAWALGITNIALEADLAPHWTLSVPLYYCAWDYFSYNTKLRNFSLYPEVKYYLRNEDMSLYFGAHFGIIYYNFAFGGGYRYQDTNRKKPALGGGVTVGWRTPLDKLGRWHFAFEIGAGFYHLNYNVIPNPGLKAIDEIHRNRFGLDNVAATFSYCFNIDQLFHHK